MTEIDLLAAPVKPGDDEWQVALWPQRGEDYILDEDGKSIAILMTSNGARLFASLLLKHAETTDELNAGTHGEVKIKGDKDDLQQLFRLIRGDG